MSKSDAALNALGRVMDTGTLGVGWWDTFADALADEGYYLAPLTTDGGPTARTTDPRTSHGWNPDTMKAGTQAHRLLQTFARWPDDGLTDEQAMEKSEGVSPLSEYAKRCSDLRHAGLILDTGRDRKGGSGLDRIVSEITAKGIAVLKRLEGS